MVQTTRTSWWIRRSGPQRIGLVFAALGLLLAVVGIARGNVPLNPLSIFLALLISGGTWGLVSWAIATAAKDVEDDVAAAAEADAASGMSLSLRAPRTLRTTVQLQLRPKRALLERQALRPKTKTTASPESPLNHIPPAVEDKHGEF